MGERPVGSVALVGQAPETVRVQLERALGAAGWHVLAASPDLDADDLAWPGPTPEVVVLLELRERSVVALPFLATDEVTWDEQAEAPARRALRLVQAAFAGRGPGGVLVVLVQPATALEGSAGLVAATTGWEAQRTLVKSAARRWGAQGLRANVVAVRPDLLAGGEDRVPADALRTVPALGDEHRGIDAVVDAVLLLLRPEAAGLTGATIAVDGGALMQP